MTLRIAFLTAALWFPLVTQARLGFVETSVLVKATNEDKSLGAKFAFTNTGPDPIDILSLTSSCGCTVPTIEKMHYAPGESGMITVAYTIGASEGPQSQTISVLTSENTDNHYSLTFNAEIPRGLKMSLPPVVPVTPRLLYWQKKPFETKTVTVDLRATPAAKLTITCDRNDNFRIQAKDSPGKRETTIEVTPIGAAAGEMRGELTINLETANGRNSPYKVFLHVLPEKISEASKN